jgi:hypothetical protein
MKYVERLVRGRADATKPLKRGTVGQPLGEQHRTSVYEGSDDRVQVTLGRRKRLATRVAHLSVHKGVVAGA